MEILIFMCLPVLLVPAIVLCVPSWRDRWKGAIAGCGVGLLICIGAYFGAQYAGSYDVQILNGEVTGKDSYHTSCEHSYSCNCRQSCSGSGSSRSCTTVCDTCYEHSYDVNWRLKTNLSDILIRRVDRQGTHTPPRWESSKVGDPVAETDSYRNYIKGAPNSLFNTTAEKNAYAEYLDKIPRYPDTVYDYHYVDRFVDTTGKIQDRKEWNAKIADTLKRIGPKMQSNLIIHVTPEKSPIYAEALRAVWLGGKKNDVIVVIGAPEYPKIEWVRVVSWTDNEMFKQSLAQGLTELETLDYNTAMPLIETEISKGFVRKSMKDFEYLKWANEVPVWVIALAITLSLVFSIWIMIQVGELNGRAFNRRYR